MKNPLVPRKVELEAQIANLEKTKTNRVEPVRKWILEANSLGKLVSGENFGEMKSFLQKVGLNRVFRDQTLTVSFIKPWDSLAQTKKATPCVADFDALSAKWWRWSGLTQCAGSGQLRRNALGSARPTLQGIRRETEF